MPLGDCFCMYSKSSSKSPPFYEHLCENNNKKIIAVSHLKTSDYKNMLRYLMESCVLFDYTVIYLFQGYYLILNCKKVPWNRKIFLKTFFQIIYTCHGSTSNLYKFVNVQNSILSVLRTMWCSNCFSASSCFSLNV